MDDPIIYFILIFLSGFSVYVHQKLKNKATKEDIGEITEEVEEVKLKHNFQLEEMKLELDHKSVATSEKREVYKEITETMRIFIKGGGATQEKKDSFLKSYQHIWLWGSDEVVSSLTVFIRHQLIRSGGNRGNDQTDAKKAYVDCIIAMRKDLGFLDTALTSGDYEFVNPVSPSE